MTAIALGVLGLMLVGYALVRRAPARPPPGPRWGIVARKGPPAHFSCGHRTRRNAAYCCGAGVENLFIRKVPRWLASEVPCPDCVLDQLSEMSRQEAVGFERLVPIQDAIDLASRQKNRPD